MMNLEKMTHLLPESVNEMVGVIGLPNTLKVVETLGGTTVDFPSSGMALHPVVEVSRSSLGDDVLNQLSAYFAGNAVYIPRCQAALHELNKQQFVDELLTLVDGGLSLSAAIMQLCPKYKISDRTA